MYVDGEVAPDPPAENAASFAVFVAEGGVGSHDAVESRALRSVLNWSILSSCSRRSSSWLCPSRSSTISCGRSRAGQGQPTTEGGVSAQRRTLWHEGSDRCEEGCEFIVELVAHLSLAGGVCRASLVGEVLRRGCRGDPATDKEGRQRRRAVRMTTKSSLRASVHVW